MKNLVKFDDLNAFDVFSVDRGGGRDTRYVKLTECRIARVTPSAMYSLSGEIALAPDHIYAGDCALISRGDGKINLPVARRGDMPYSITMRTFDPESVESICRAFSGIMVPYHFLNGKNDYVLTESLLSDGIFARTCRVLELRRDGTLIRNTHPRKSFPIVNANLPSLSELPEPTEEHLWVGGSRLLNCHHGIGRHHHGGCFLLDEDDVAMARLIDPEIKIYEWWI